MSMKLLAVVTPPSIYPDASVSKSQKCSPIRLINEDHTIDSEGHVRKEIFMSLDKIFLLRFFLCDFFWEESTRKERVEQRRKRGERCFKN